MGHYSSQRMFLADLDLPPVNAPRRDLRVVAYAPSMNPAVFTVARRDIDTTGLQPGISPLQFKVARRDITDTAFASRLGYLVLSPGLIEIPLTDYEQGFGRFYTPGRVDIAESVLLPDGAMAAQVPFAEIPESTSRVWYTRIPDGYATGSITRHYTATLDDLTLPVSNFSYARSDNGSTQRNYLTLTVPGSDYLEEIEDRSDGTLTLWVILSRRGVEVQREELVSGTFDEFQYSIGGRSRLCVLRASATSSDRDPQTVQLRAPLTSMSTNAGKRTLNVAFPDFYIQPGDTLTTDDYEFVVGSITTYSSVSYTQTTITEV